MGGTPLKSQGRRSISESVPSLARYLGKEVFPGPVPPTVEEKRSMVWMGVLSLAGFVCAVAFLGAFFFNMVAVFITLGYLVEVFQPGPDNETAALALCRTIQQAVPLIIGLGALARAGRVWREQQTDLQRRRLASPEEKIEIDPPVDQSLRARLLRLIDYLPLTGVRFFFEAWYPEAYIRPSPYALPGAAILALLAEKTSMETELVNGSLGPFLPSACEPLVIAEAMRLLRAGDFFTEKAALNSQGREIRRLSLSERGQLVAKRFGLSLEAPGSR